MLFKIQIFRGFDKNQSYGLFSIYIKHARPEIPNRYVRFTQSLRLEYITDFWPANIWVYCRDSPRQADNISFPARCPPPKKSTSLHRDETPKNHTRLWVQAGKVDYRMSKPLLWRFREPTFSRTCSTVKIAQTRIVEPIHPLLNKKTLAQLWAEIISSIERSGLHLTVLNEMGGGRD